MIHHRPILITSLRFSLGISQGWSPGSTDPRTFVGRTTVNFYRVWNGVWFWRDLMNAARHRDWLVGIDEPMLNLTVSDWKRCGESNRFFSSFMFFSHFFYIIFILILTLNYAIVLCIRTFFVLLIISLHPITRPTGLRMAKVLRDGSI